MCTAVIMVSAGGWLKTSLILILILVQNWYIGKPLYKMCYILFTYTVSYV